MATEIYTRRTAAASSGPVTEINPFPVEVLNSDPLKVAGVGSVIQVVPVISTAAYAADDCIGGGPYRLRNAVRTEGGNGILQSVILTDHANNGPTLGAMDILIFNEIPLGVTFTDNSAFPTLTLPNLLGVVGVVRILTSDYATLGGSAIAMKAGLGIQVTSRLGSKDLWFAINARQAADYAAVNDLTLTFGFVQN